MLQNRPCPRKRSGSTPHLIPVPAPTSVDGPAARPVTGPRVPQCPAVRDHRARASELAALAFLLPQAIPAQRDPHPSEVRPAV